MTRSLDSLTLALTGNSLALFGSPRGHAMRGLWRTCLDATRISSLLEEAGLVMDGERRRADVIERALRGELSASLNADLSLALHMALSVGRGELEVVISLPLMQQGLHEAVLDVLGDLALGGLASPAEMLAPESSEAPVEGVSQGEAEPTEPERKPAKAQKRRVGGISINPSRCLFALTPASSHATLQALRTIAKVSLVDPLPHRWTTC